MNIRDYLDSDQSFIKDVHVANGLDDRCMADLQDPLFFVRRILEHDGQPAMACVLKATAEIYLFVDHSKGTPEQRWEWLQQLNKDIRQQAWAKGLNEITCWLPDAIDKSFSKRLETLGYTRSPWRSYTLTL